MLALIVVFGSYMPKLGGDFSWGWCLGMNVTLCDLEAPGLAHPGKDFYRVGGWKRARKKKKKTHRLGGLYSPHFTATHETPFRGLSRLKPIINCTVDDITPALPIIRKRP